jgi:pyruvate dehydrogenase (quinone)
MGFAVGQRNAAAPSSPGSFFMSQTVSDFIIERLIEWKIDRIYGYPGDGINGLMGALRRREKEIRFIQTRHEEMAAFMAVAHAKFTGDVGVCMATSGPGAIHLLNGLYDGKMDHAPVVAIVGQSATSVLGSHFQQEVDLPNLFKDVASESVIQVASAAGVRHAIDRALRIALDQRTVTTVILPKDLQEEKAVAKSPHVHDSVHSGVGYTAARVIPRGEDLKGAAAVLNAGQKVAMLVGAGALRASEEALEIAEILGAGMSKSWLGIAVVSDHLPFVCGHIGVLVTKPPYDMMTGCDTSLVGGSRFHAANRISGRGGQAARIDHDWRMLNVDASADFQLSGRKRLK